MFLEEQSFFYTPDDFFWQRIII